MADGTLRLEIVTPHRRLISAEADEVTAPGFHGEFGVLPGHTPYLVQLGVGILSYRSGSARYFLSIIGGYAEVGPDRVTILTEVAERAEDINTQRARAALHRAEERMMGRSQDSIDFERAELALKRAVTRLGVARQSGMA
ncbi:MAG: F0F1 ATP synthase subunit epsilon [Candidatus Tectomicrobia bacterium]|uniref:ATP synthase epsilon chain n=1 Tax=Tectimicrobiota bacterium TaxID=2528274 RepID=A0A932HXR8_UNCTE|nr:F0F1 ATP synthase subunit epsilon [Candidatus Tectomicrobia bacterium]